MDIQPISSNKFLVGLSRDDMIDLDITYDDMDYSNIETRRVIWTILDTVRRDTGRDVDPSGSLMIEAAPDPCGGCLLMFTVASGMNRKPETVISKNDQSRIFEFENVDDMLDLMKLLPEDAVRHIFTDGGKYRLELRTQTASGLGRLLGEYGKFVGKDRLTVAVTHEHWTKIK